MPIIYESDAFYLVEISGWLAQITGLLEVIAQKLYEQPVQDELKPPKPEPEPKQKASPKKQPKKKGKSNGKKK